MPFIPTSDVARVELRMLLASQRVENVLHFKKVGFDQAALDALVDAVASWWNTDYKLIQTASLTHSQVYGRGIRTAEDIESTNVDFLNSPGSLDAALDPAMPNHVSLCVSLRTGQTGRSARGRFYAVGLTQDQITLNAVTSAYSSALVAALGQLDASVALAGWSWGVVSFHSNNLPRTAGRFLDITSVSVVDSVVDSQRRRLPNRGN